MTTYKSFVHTAAKAAFVCFDCRKPVVIGEECTFDNTHLFKDKPTRLCRHCGSKAENGNAGNGLSSPAASESIKPQTNREASAALESTMTIDQARYHIKTKIDALEARIARLEEQNKRIVEANIVTYKSLQAKIDQKADRNYDHINSLSNSVN